MTGLYDQNTACGSCAIDCTVLYALPNASGTCVVAGTRRARWCATPNAFNLDGAIANGCEFVARSAARSTSRSTIRGRRRRDAAASVRPAPAPGNHPCRTIAQGIARATR